MCGIFWYAWSYDHADDYIIDGLQKLEYRGYDSAWVALHNGKNIELYRAVGKVADLSETVHDGKKPDAIYHLWIGHTRWATHWGVTLENTHPHHDSNREIFLAHNGIIENYKDLKNELENKGYSFYGQTDSEVIAKCIESAPGANLLEKVKNTLPRLEGAYALLIISKSDPTEMIGVRYGSPLVFAKGKKNCFFFSSDTHALAPHTKDIVFLNDGDVVHVQGGRYTIQREWVLVDRPIERINTERLHAEKGDFKHFMLKEIHEIPEVMQDVFRGRINFKDLSLTADSFHHLRECEIEYVEFVACGSSYHAWLLGAHWIQELAGIRSSAIIASEFFSRPVHVNKRTLYVFISQSGETADAIEPLKYLKEQGAHTFGIVNVVGSTIARLTSNGLFTHAGTEVWVASTKAFIAQLGTILFLSLFFSISEGSDYRLYRSVIDSLESLEFSLNRVLAMEASIAKISKEFSVYKHCFFLGRGASIPVAMEAALKCKEISYIHATALPLGELKHGSLALIDENCPSVVFVPNDGCFAKSISNIEEIRARGGKVLAISEKPILEADWNIVIPESNAYIFPILASVAGELFAYHVAESLGHDIDKPRNLAKSVTVL